MCRTREIGRLTVRDRSKDVNLSHVGMVGLVALEPTHLFLWNVEYHPQRTNEEFHEMRTHMRPPH